MLSVQSARDITGECEVPNLQIGKNFRAGHSVAFWDGGKVSNVLKNNFFTVSRELVDGGHLGALSGSAVKLYVLLMMLAQKHSAVEIQIPASTQLDFADLMA